MRAIPESTAAKVLLAADMIAERGLDGTKIEELASVTGVPKATLYYYFEGKEGILSHIFGVVLDALEVAVRDGVAVQGDAAHRLRQSSPTTSRFSGATPALARHCISTSGARHDDPTWPPGTGRRICSRSAR